jgi:hypothetical protein
LTKVFEWIAKSPILSAYPLQHLKPTTVNALGTILAVSAQSKNNDIYNSLLWMLYFISQCYWCDFKGLLPYLTICRESVDQSLGNAKKLLLLLDNICSDFEGKTPPSPDKQWSICLRLPIQPPLIFCPKIQRSLSYQRSLSGLQLSRYNWLCEQDSSQEKIDNMILESPSENGFCAQFSLNPDDHDNLSCFSDICLALHNALQHWLSNREFIPGNVLDALQHILFVTLDALPRLGKASITERFATECILDILHLFASVSKPMPFSDEKLQRITNCFGALPSGVQSGRFVFFMAAYLVRVRSAMSSNSRLKWFATQLLAYSTSLRPSGPSRERIKKLADSLDVFLRSGSV